MPAKLQISAPIATVASNPSTAWQKLKSDPSRFIADRFYAHRPPMAQTLTDSTSITLVCISDTHNKTLQIPDGDVLLHAGDLTEKGTFTELQAQLDWINTLPHSHKVVIGGNHDRLLDETFVTNNPERFQPGDTNLRLDWGQIVYLNDISTTITVRERSLKVFGSPVTPQCGNFAFQYLPIRNVWKNRIPDGTDIVLAHGPPKGHLDLGGKGCEWFLRELWRIKPRLAVFGHIHRGRGQEVVNWDLIQYGYDFPGFSKIVIMALALAWSWALNWLRWGRRRPKTVLVNAAIGNDEDSIQVVHL